MADQQSSGWRRILNRPKRARTPTVLQLEAAECGAASLAMVLAHFGRRVPLEELRLACGVSRDGSKASNVLKAARSFGLVAKGLKAEPEHLSALAVPMIAFVNFCHFLVVEGITAKQVFLNDPAQGRYSVSREEFDAMFTGVVLVFSPGPDFIPGDSRPSLIESLWRRSGSVRSAVIYALLISLSLVIPGIALPVFSKVFIDYFVVRDLHDWLAPLLAGLVFTAFVRLALGELRNWHLTRAETRLAIRGARELFEHILKLPISFFGARYAGEVASRLHLSDGLAHLLTGQLAQAFLNLVTAAFFFVIMLFYSIPLSLWVLALSALSMAILYGVTRSASDGYRRLSIQQGKLDGVALAALRDIETYKASGAESLIFSRWSGLHAGTIQIQQEMTTRLAILGVAPVFVSALMSAAVLIAGGLNVMDGKITIGSLVAFQTLSASFIAPLVALMGLGTNLQEVRSFTERIDDILQQPVASSEIQLQQHKDGMDRLPAGEISLEGASFGYMPLEAPLIQRLNLSVTPGSSIALVGASGSGKSTVGRLLVGLFAPTEGRVLLDSKPLDHWPSHARQITLGYVDQSIVLFEGTIRENLTLWDETVPDHDIVAAARDAMIHDVISERAGGYSAQIEEGGRNFSGGQRQRFEIARALANNPRLLVLDEATSALDAVTEAAIMDNLRRRGCTLVIIAHRLSTIRDCDEIIVLDRGQVLERGRHDELMASGGAYARLIEA